MICSEHPLDCRGLTKKEARRKKQDARIRGIRETLQTSAQNDLILRELESKLFLLGDIEAICDCCLHPDLGLRHPLEANHTVGELLERLAPTAPANRGPVTTQALPVPAA